MSSRRHLIFFVDKIASNRQKSEKKTHRNTEAALLDSFPLWFTFSSLTSKPKRTLPEPERKPGGEGSKSGREPD
ncbi:hypothetical protein TNIN_113731 [Trichonephila inaurata madagascariensis]|uniref:Uncharacterized protein n=1 Tax=Trichonephila inaurata madagascariensis TaxID=2747483 RepID=A0A8X7CKM2_9ARAC|nr:hypothetical protein TNIN_489391 [Trichonephila inaurata madagascariensis]GFY79163.1 hypothetical protein TNIN_113731 [Trichonephila inaurata madagascariensis]